MSNTSSLQINTSVNGDQLVVTATVGSGSYLPSNIFIYENNGTTSLGRYVGICNVDELTRFQVWTGTAIPVFGNKFLRSSQAKIQVRVADTVESTIQSIIQNLTTTATLLSKELEAVSSSQVVTITT